MLFLILIVKYIFRFRFRPKMAGFFVFVYFFGRKRRFIFRLFLFYGRKSKIHFRSASNYNQCTNDASFGAHHGNLKQDRSILSAGKCIPGTYLQAIRLMRIFAGGSVANGLKRQRSGQNRRLLVHVIGRHIIASLRVEADIIMRRHVVPYRLTSDPEMTLKCHFMLRSVFIVATQLRGRIATAEVRNQRISDFNKLHCAS